MSDRDDDLIPDHDIWITVYAQAVQGRAAKDSSGFIADSAAYLADRAVADYKDRFQTPSN